MSSKLRQWRDEVALYSSVMIEFRRSLRTHEYTLTSEDVDVVRTAAKDLRPFSYGLGAGLGTWWLLRRATKASERARSLPMRFFTSVGRLGLAGVAYSLGASAGSLLQARDCMRQMVALPTPLGGEIAAILREKQPDHPLLRFERPPETSLDESRPRIATEENRLAKLQALALQKQQEQGAAEHSAGGRRDGAAADNAASVTQERVDGVNDSDRSKGGGGDVFELLGMPAGDRSGMDEGGESAEADAAARRRRRRRRIRRHASEDE